MSRCRIVVIAFMSAAGAALMLLSAVPPALAEQKAWRTSNFRFEMSGLPAAKGGKGLTNKGRQKAHQIRTMPLWGVRVRNRL